MGKTRHASKQAIIESGCGQPFLVGDLYDTGDAYVLPVTPCCEADVTFIDPSNLVTGKVLPEVLVCRQCKRPAEHKLNAAAHKFDSPGLYQYVADFREKCPDDGCVADTLYWIGEALEDLGFDV